MPITSKVQKYIKFSMFLLSISIKTYIENRFCGKNRSPREFYYHFTCFPFFKKLPKNWQSPKLRYVSTRDKKTFCMLNYYSSLQNWMYSPNIVKTYIWERKLKTIQLNLLYLGYVCSSVLCCLQLSQSFTWLSYLALCSRFIAQPKSQCATAPLPRRSKFYSVGGRLAPKGVFRLQSTVSILCLCWLHSPCE